MKYIKKFRLFENLESEIDLKELEGLLIDFKQMGLDHDIKTGSSIVIDWNLFNDDNYGGSKTLYSNAIDKYGGKYTRNSLTIEFKFNTDNSNDYNIKDTSEAYDMIKDYLENYNLIPNYILYSYNYNYLYFETFDTIKEYKSRISDFSNPFRMGSEDENIFKANKLVFGFYK
jgi:hypothetical protein